MYVNDVLDDLLTEDQIIIRNHIGEDEVLAQMAEEAAELAQACLKLRRALMNVNPTPVSEQEAVAKLAEEVTIGIHGRRIRMVISGRISNMQV